MMTLKYIKSSKLLMYGLVIITALLIAGITWAAFADKGKVLGGSFTTGSSDVKFLERLDGGVDAENLKDELPGPDFSNITPHWLQDHAVKLFNNGTTPLGISTHSNYATTNDPDELRSYIFVEPYLWDDSNNNGILDEGELGTSFGKKTITKWKTEGFDLGSIDIQQTMGLILRFSTDDLSDTKQGKSGIFDFEFDAAQL